MHADAPRTSGHQWQGECGGSRSGGGVSRQARLGDVAYIVSGVGFPKEIQGQAEGEVPVFKVGDISNALKSGNRYLRTSPNHLSKDGARKLAANLMPAGTTVFAKIGEGLKLNRRAILAQPSLVDNNVMGLVPKLNLATSAYLYYFMQTIDLGKLSRATAVPSVRKSDVVEIPIPLPSLPKQEEIVDEIEKQFSRLDEAVANLKRVKANLKRYKAAVLKAAVEGRLVPTEAELARREARSYETGAQLLQRILETRRSQWKGNGKYREPAAPDTIALSELPEGWAWGRLDAIAALRGGITVDSKRKDLTARSVPYLRVANVQRGYLDLAEVKQIDAPAADIEELRLRPGDILFNEGGDRDKLGRGWIWEGQLADCIHQNHVFRARLFCSEVSSKLVSWWGNSFGKDYFLREGKQTTNLASINLTKLSAFPVPLPSLAEQQRITAEVDRRLSFVNEVESQVDANLKRAERLRSSVLSRVFAVINDQT